MEGSPRGSRWRSDLLWRGVLDEVNALINVRLEALDGNCEQFLLFVRDVFEDIDGFGSTVSLYLELANDRQFILGETNRKLDGNGEEVHAGGLGDGVTAWNTGQVDKGRLCFALGTLEGLDHVLGESV